jgi:triosephosphate isomerase
MKKLIVANWKMNKNTQDIDFWVNEFLSKYAPNIDFSKITVAVAPSHPYLSYLSQIKNKFQVCAQDVHTNQQGTFTGSVAAFQLREFVTHVLVGHSETHSTFEQTCEKAFIVMKNEMTPIVCLSDFSSIQKLPDYFINSFIALEDPNDISSDGHYKNVDSKFVSDRVLEFTTKLGREFLGLLYGGSVNRQNAEELGNIVGLDGLLVGNASLDPGHFFEVIKGFSKNL